MSQHSSDELPALPQGLTSFGAAKLGDSIYVYGGHRGTAHHYYAKGQSSDLLCLDLSTGDPWDVVSQGPHLQGGALVSHDGKLYRIGGFTAHNAEDEPQNLQSLADFCSFDPAIGQWRTLPPMPEPRSSFDAVVIDGTLYVAGGWRLEGEKESNWRETLCSIDLAAPEDELQWKLLAKPPFQRRALSLGWLEEKVYVIGGMQEVGEPTGRVAIYEPHADVWSEGPSLPGEPMEGFGSAAFHVDGALYVSTYSGAVLRLASGADSWTTVGAIQPGRFFHRMLPGRKTAGQTELLFIGGANMQHGKIAITQSLSIESVR